MCIKQQIVELHQLKIGSRVLIRDQETKRVKWWRVEYIQPNKLLSLKSCDKKCVLFNVSVSEIIDCVL